MREDSGHMFYKPQTKLGISEVATGEPFSRRFVEREWPTRIRSDGCERSAGTLCASAQTRIQPRSAQVCLQPNPWCACFQFCAARQDRLDRFRPWQYNLVRGSLYLRRSRHLLLLLLYRRSRRGCAIRVAGKPQSDLSARWPAASLASGFFIFKVFHLATMGALGE